MLCLFLKQRANDQEVNVVKARKKVYIRHVLAQTLLERQVSIGSLPEDLAPIIARIQEFAEFVMTDPKKIFNIRDHGMGLRLKYWLNAAIYDLAIETAERSYYPVSRKELNLGHVFNLVLSGCFETNVSDFVTDLKGFFSRLSQGIQNIKAYTVPDRAWIRRLGELCQDAQETIIY